MGSDSNKMNDGTSFQPSEPQPCTNGCGFFGTAATNGYCSKCFRDIRVHEEQAASAIAAVDKLVNKVVNFTPPSSSSSSGSGLVTSGSGTGSDLPEPGPTQLAAQVQVKASNRCLTCNKKVGVMGFKCRCGDTFCGSHRYPEKHECEFDFKKSGRDAIAKANPVIKADKVDRI